MIRVVLGDDQQMLRSALATLLDLEGDIEVVAQGGNGAETLQMIRLHHPDVSVLDIEMPLMSGLDVADELKRLNHPGKVIILTTFAKAGYFQRAVKAGVSGYLLKDSPSGELAEAIRRAAGGGRVIHPDLSLAVWEDQSPLTARETEVLAAAAKGLTMKETADRLFLSHGTVRNYMSEAMSKLEAKNKMDAVQIAQAKGWI
ncbi:DNA-binding response regulator [Paenibacillus nanensis]|uniref:DNA-binding response regulator n=1 Tax=Paenibacillus nanensis TaxID=393251 RepID=A0A3A1VGT8_9BACL|nr:response regulator transcription factor [Paenibacillus nanensis]RIX59475.1 DNA-binding response regulator [Paenibacillus nanensis]